VAIAIAATLRVQSSVELSDRHHKTMEALGLTVGITPIPFRLLVNILVKWTFIFVQGTKIRNVSFTSHIL